MGDISVEASILSNQGIVEQLGNARKTSVDYTIQRPFQMKKQKSVSINQNPTIIAPNLLRPSDIAARPKKIPISQLM